MVSNINGSFATCHDIVKNTVICMWHNFFRWVGPTTCKKDMWSAQVTGTHVLDGLFDVFHSSSLKGHQRPIANARCVCALTFRGSFRLYHSMAPSCSSLSPLLLQMVSWKSSRFCTSQVKFDSTRISVLNCARDMTIHVATQTLCAAYFKSDLPGVVWCMLAWPYLSSEAHKIHTMKQLWGWNRLSTVSLLERWRHSLQDARSRTAIPGNYQAAGQAKRQTGQNLLQSMCRLLMMIAKMMTSWLKNIVWNRACSSHPIRHQLNRATAQHATHTHVATSSLPFQKEMRFRTVLRLFWL